MSKQSTKQAIKPVSLKSLVNPTIFTLNQSSDKLLTLRNKVAFLQEAMSPERDEMFLDWEALSGLNEDLNQLFDGLLVIGDDLATASHALQAIK